MGWKDSDDKRQKQCQLDHCLCEMVINLAVRTGFIYGRIQPVIEYRKTWSLYMSFYYYDWKHNRLAVDR